MEYATFKAKYFTLLRNKYWRKKLNAIFNQTYEGKLEFRYIEGLLNSPLKGKKFPSQISWVLNKGQRMDFRLWNTSKT